MHARVSLQHYFILEMTSIETISPGLTPTFSLTSLGIVTWYLAVTFDLGIEA